MAKVIDADSDLAGNLPESPDRGARKAESAELLGALEELSPKALNVTELLEQFKDRARFGGVGGTELSPDAQTLSALKSNFDANPQLHNGVTWKDAENALKKSPDSLAKLAKLIVRGGEPTVTGEENGEIMFEEVSADCAGKKNIAYDKEGQKLAVKRGETCDGNAVDIAAEMGVKPIAPKRYEALRDKVEGLDQNTWSWLLTDEATRKSGGALNGYHGRADRGYARTHNDYGGVRCSLGVKKA